MTDSPRSILRRGVADHVFPGAQYAVWHRANIILSDAVGGLTYGADASAATTSTIYDIASLTKVVAATAMAMILWDRGRFDLNQPLGELLPQFLSPSDPRRSQITLRMLLAHSSGLPAYARLFEHARTPSDLLSAALQLPLESDPMARVEYSDLGFIFLGLALERIANEPLDRFTEREIFAPLAMNNTRYLPPHSSRPRIAPTADDSADFRAELIQGEVNDENAWIMGGVSAHAGLFSTAEDLCRFAACMLRGGSPLISPAAIATFTQRETLPAGTTRALGWDTPSSPSSSGSYFSPRSYGHLGFTGTSLWIDPDADLAIVLLTNRTWPRRTEKNKTEMQRIRPAFHDAVRQELGLI